MLLTDTTLFNSRASFGELSYEQKSLVLDKLHLQDAGSVCVEGSVYWFSIYRPDWFGFDDSINVLTPIKIQMQTFLSSGLEHYSVDWIAGREERRVCGLIKAAILDLLDPQRLYTYSFSFNIVTSYSASY